MAEAELELHGHEHGHVHEHDGTRFGKAVALKVSVIGVILAVVTIGSHRAHNAAVIHRTDANDQWAYYQAKKTREYVAEYAASTTPLMTTSDPARLQALTKHYSDDVERYKNDAARIEQEARLAVDRSKAEEARALNLDTSEGFFELGLVLSSLFFLARKRILPFIGMAAAAVGAVYAVYGFFIV